MELRLTLNGHTGTNCPSKAYTMRGEEWEEEEEEVAKTNTQKATAWFDINNELHV